MVPSLVSHSVNELQMLAQKAARGGGAHAAQAAHFGQALCSYLAEDGDVAPVVAALRALPNGPIQTLPFSYATLDHPPADHYRILALPRDKRASLPARLECPTPLLRLLQKLAQNTHVPSSIASRAAGAGAGLTDND